MNLLVLAADHLITGFAGVFLPERSAGLYHRLFGARIPTDTPVSAILRPWGALGIFAGITGLLPLWDPVRGRPILYSLLALLGLRIFIRLSYDSTTLEYFQLSLKRNYFHVYLVAQCAIIIALQLAWR